MIAVNVNAGLANQMFHYAFGRGLMAKGLDVCFDQSNFKPRSQWAFELVRLQDAFPSIDIKVMPEGHFKWVFPSLPRNGLERRFQEFMKKWHNLSVMKYTLTNLCMDMYLTWRNVLLEIVFIRVFGKAKSILDIVRMIYVNSLLFAF